MKLRNGTHVDRVLDVNPAATSAIVQHNALSSLLKLPLEVKNIIYKYVFGGNLIHIIQDCAEGATKFRNTICCAPISEEEAQENFDNETNHQWYVPANEGRHNCCRFQDGATFCNGIEKPQILSLEALRCCRQIYNEAHHIPYLTNTFSCDDPKTLRRFVLLLSQGSHENNLAVRSLFLEIVYDVSNPSNAWRSAVVTCVNKLPALQNLRLNVEFGSAFYVVYPLRDEEWGEEENFGKDRVISTVLTFKKLPLKIVTMVISDQRTERILRQLGLTTTLDANYRWFLQEKKERSRYVRKVLLRSNG